MSYIRNGSVYRYVDGISSDYVYPTTYEEKTEIVDYGNISDETLIELLFRYARIEDNICVTADLKSYLLNKVAERLNVKLRVKSLTDEEALKIYKELKVNDEQRQNTIFNYYFFICFFYII